MENMMHINLQSTSHAWKLYAIRVKTIADTYEAFARAQHSGQTLGDVVVELYKDTLINSLHSY